jgi:hypothetical protein
VARLLLRGPNEPHRRDPFEGSPCRGEHVSHARRDHAASPLLTYRPCFAEVAS